MTHRSTLSSLATPTAAHRVGAAFRLFVSLLIVVALPAQAISASVERVWNAAHYHLAATGSMETQTASTDADSSREAVTEHYPLQRVLDIAHGRHPAQVALRHDNNPQASRLDAHAEAHRSATPHHHNSDVRDVVYVADQGDAPTSAAQRTGKHDHDGFSPAVLVTLTLFAPLYGRSSLAITSSPCASRSCVPGERPPR